MSLAGPWPLKIVLDSVIGHHPMPHWVTRMVGPDVTDHKMGLAALAAALIIVIALLENAASYIDNYYTESVGQYVANDLRMRVYHHLDRLSLGYYDKQQTGNLLSHDHHRHHDHPELRLRGDARDPGRRADDHRHARPHVLAQLGLRPDRRGRDAIPAALRHAVQEGRQEGDPRGPAPPERHRRRRPGGPRVDAGGQGVRPRAARGGAPPGGEPGGRRRGTQGPEDQVAAIAGGRGGGRVLRGLRSLPRLVADPARGDDHRRADGLPVVPEQVLQAGAGPGEDDQHDRPGRSRRRARPADPRRRRR